MWACVRSPITCTSKRLPTAWEKERVATTVTTETKANNEQRRSLQRRCNGCSHIVLFCQHHADSLVPSRLLCAALVTQHNIPVCWPSARTCRLTIGTNGPFLTSLVELSFVYVLHSGLSWSPDLPTKRNSANNECVEPLLCDAWVDQSESPKLPWHSCRWGGAQKTDCALRVQATSVNSLDCSSQLASVVAKLPFPAAALSLPAASPVPHGLCYSNCPIGTA